MLSSGVVCPSTFENNWKGNNKDAVDDFYFQPSDLRFPIVITKEGNINGRTQRELQR